MLSTTVALVEANDDVMDIAIVAAIILCLLAAFWQRRAEPGAPHLGWVGVAAVAFGLLFLTGP